jgi:glutaconyl-CoA/methylmalonyl-CoA decarboxylase subunit delta
MTKMKIIAIAFNPSLVDHYAVIITIVGYSIVLLSLALMAYLFTRLHTIQNFLFKRKNENAGSRETEAPKVKITGEENAAIAAALFLFFSELHDEEKYVMTIRKVSKVYSPWNSKIYGIWNNIKYW